jgi:hypothetical protein
MAIQPSTTGESGMKTTKPLTPRKRTKIISDATNELSEHLCRYGLIRSWGSSFQVSMEPVIPDAELDAHQNAVMSLLEKQGLTEESDSDAWEEATRRLQRRG